MASSNDQLYLVEVATGSAQEIHVGFRPRRIEITSDTGDQAVWQHGMADASMFKRTDAGVGSLVTSNGITPDGTKDGGSSFTLGADADVNQADAKLYIVAYR